MLSPSRRGSRWLSWIAGLLAIGTMLVLSVVFRVTENRGKAWPILQAVTARLATDEGARDLYAKNPQLADSYASADIFVDAVRAHRTAFGVLPDREPATDRERYEAYPDPDRLRAFVKGTGGAWMSLELERSDGTEAGHTAIGEGITFLGFGDSASKLKDLRSATRAAFAEGQWSKFTAVERSLLTEEGTQALLQANPSLAKDDAARTSFLQRTRIWRSRLAASTPPATWAKAEEAPDDVVRFMHRNGPLFGDRTEMDWKPKGGAWLRIKWENGRLVKVVLED